MADATPSPTNPTGKKPMSNLTQRILYGVLGAVALLFSIWYSAWTFAMFFGLVQMRMLWEFYRMMRKAGYKPAALLGGGISLMLFGAIYLVADAHHYTASHADGNVRDIILAIQIGKVAQNVLLGLAILLPTILILREMYSWPRKNELAPFANVGVALLGLLYVSLPMSLLNVLAFSDKGYDYRRIFGLLLLVWCSDIGAYAAGKTFGKHKLAPSISPGKTWEGAIGGFLLTLGMGWALGFLLPEMPLPTRLVAAAVVAIFGPLGDLAESMLKRSVDVKDSGRIMPGHGGLLDRFDAFLFVVPVLVVVQLLFG
ncbi:MULTISPECIES: phosphatidate cytidylyltransferase [Hymenobacter]|uniref:Phosphatidate cytidylyltransferase n=1 Tax=Hymenobacter profundi TaxID=1982110 RepID=A0ABS6WX13_9BACT|nr:MULTISPECIES: phosphatidate cytidylyltransferase [Hymenobacter]MBW3128130.1 phosphatidate cytidylyltransferase [Hymenobacter profundi]QNE41250.1 phosphatidate cytidylyltransferase [Hymenobacter sp. NBH84]